MSRSILFAINTLGIGGAERALLSLLGELPKDEFDIDLAVITSQGELVGRVPAGVSLISDCKPTSVLSKEGRKDLERTVIKNFFKQGRGFKLLSYMLVNFFDMLFKRHIRPDKLLWRLLSDSYKKPGKHYDLAVAYIEGAATYYVADHVEADRKVAFVHVDYAKAGYTRKLDGNCYKHFNRIFTVSREIRNPFLKIHPECRSRMSVFENRVDQDAIIEASYHEGGFSDTYTGKRILSVCRLTTQKALEYSIDALAILKRRGINARWYVLGEGDQRQTLEKRIREQRLESDFILMGAVEDPYPYIRQCDVYVHASRFEGKSIALQEAKTIGCPIVATDVSGNREQIKHGENGLLCRLDSGEIAESVEILLSDRDLALKLGEKASSEVIPKVDVVGLLFGEDIK